MMLIRLIVALFLATPLMASATAVPRLTALLACRTYDLEYEGLKDSPFSSRFAISRSGPRYETVDDFEARPRAAMSLFDAPVVRIVSVEGETSPGQSYLLLRGRLEPILHSATRYYGSPPVWCRSRDENVREATFVTHVDRDRGGQILNRYNARFRQQGPNLVRLRCSNGEPIAPTL